MSITGVIEIVLASVLTLIVLVVAAIVRHHHRRTSFVHPHADYRGYLDQPRMTPQPKGWTERMRGPR